LKVGAVADPGGWVLVFACGVDGCGCPNVGAGAALVLDPKPPKPAPKENPVAGWPNALDVATGVGAADAAKGVGVMVRGGGAEPKGEGCGCPKLKPSLGFVVIVLAFVLVGLAVLTLAVELVVTVPVFAAPKMEKPVLAGADGPGVAVLPNGPGATPVPDASTLVPLPRVPVPNKPPPPPNPVLVCSGVEPLLSMLGAAGAVLEVACWGVAPAFSPDVGGAMVDVDDWPNPANPPNPPNLTDVCCAACRAATGAVAACVSDAALGA